MDGNSRPYHHGDLRAALIESGLVLARTGGIASVGVREVTRRVGVTPNAAYRHFSDQRALVLAVAHRARDQFAAAILEKARVMVSDDTPAEQALASLRGVGLGYIDFAVSEPGWFELAYSTQDEVANNEPSVTVEGRTPQPFQLLLDALDAMLDAGVLNTEQRRSAEWSCWSAVHGFADLATRGPLRAQHRSVVDGLAVRVVDNIIQGIRA